MIDNKYPLFSPDLMQENSFSKVAYGFRHADPDEWVSGAVGFVVDKEDKKISTGNPFFYRISRFIQENGIDSSFLDSSPTKNT